MQSSKEQQGEIKKVFLTDQCKETEKNNPCSSAGKEFAYNAEDLGSIPKLGRSPGEGKGYPLQYSGLENSMDCIVQISSVTQSCLTLCIIHGVTKSWIQLSDFHLLLACYS